MAEAYTFWLSQESKTPTLLYTSPQLDLRPEIINWMCDTCFSLDLRLTTLHLAVHYLDIFMDAHSVNESQLELLALSSIQIAAKFEEMETAIPYAREYADFTKEVFSDAICMKMELKILEYMDWRVSIPTVAHFCGYYSTKMVDETDTFDGRPLNAKQVDIAQSICEEYMPCLVNIPLHDIGYRKWRPSVVACAVVAAARSLVKLYPVWPARLQLLTNTPEAQIQTLVQWIIVGYDDIKLKEELSRQCTDFPDVKTDGEVSATKSFSPQYISNDGPQSDEVKVALQQETVAA